MRSKPTARSGLGLEVLDGGSTTSSAVALRTGWAARSAALLLDLRKKIIFLRSATLCCCFRFFSRRRLPLFLFLFLASAGRGGGSDWPGLLDGGSSSAIWISGDGGGGDCWVPWSAAWFSVVGCFHSFSGRRLFIFR
ncbi:hypothetical protein HAX54_020183 [Datura stramonium]|uniref:Uncharacterized protein n=1 Tax=Datura stramonium TaxID=4076 RepID=A0ABS8USK6_DATST|nr:hypothetical protein [Datura stramonium]